MKKLKGSTSILRGSPATLIYEDSDTVYIVDPGHGSKRAKQLRKILEKLGKPAVFLITHYHSDHLEALSHNIGVPFKITATYMDSPGIEYPVYRIGMTFGAPLESWEDAMLYKAPALRVDEKIKCGDSVGPLETIHLPGHTPGQIGVLTPDNVLYVADAVFGERVLENYLAPYHRDPCTALESLHRLLDVDFDILVPGHGPVLERAEAEKLIQLNIRVLEDFQAKLFEYSASGSTYQAILEKVMDGRSPESPGLYMLVEQAVRGGLTCLAGRGKLTLDTTVNPPLWKAESSREA